MLPVNQFIDFINQNKLFAPGTKVLAAVSGGMDSVLMAHLLKQAVFDFGIAHCNFMLRGDEALADQAFVSNLADELGVSFHTVEFHTKKHAADHKISIQMAARNLRYQWFANICQTAGYHVIALAHHQNDTIETILLNLTRGTGIAGLHGILPMKGNLVRPMLFLTRDEIQTTVTREGLKYVEDSSNASTKYARNKIRLQVMPLLKELNPSIEQTFENNLKHFRDLETLLNNQVEALRLQLLTYHEDGVHIPLDEIAKLNPQRLLLHQLLLPYGFTDVVVDDLLTALDKHAGRLFESAGYLAVVDRAHLIISKRETTNDVVLIEEGTHSINYLNYKLTVLHDDSALIIKDNPLAVSVDAAKLIYPLTLRAWQQGDQFYPLGMKTRQKLSDFFIHQKVPLKRKHTVPVMINGNNEIVWIGGYRLDERYKVGDNTKKVTIFELIKL